MTLELWNSPEVNENRKLTLILKTKHSDKGGRENEETVDSLTLGNNLCLLDFYGLQTEDGGGRTAPG
jgi:hypothetical protein